MKSSILKGLVLPIALMALGGVEQASAASATICASSYTLTAVTAAGFSCVLGALTFSNFADVYTDSGPGASTPNPATQITVNISELTSGFDPFGTGASAGSPIYSVITNYSGANSVAESQSETGVVQYLVTDSTAGTGITEVDAAITGLAANTATGTLNKNICGNGQFGVTGTTPNGVCSAGAPMIAASALALTSPAGVQADGTPDFNAPFTLSTMGVYDSWTLTGGSASPSASADVTAVENDFVETTGIAITPEPGTLVLLGGAMVCLGLMRRRRKLT